MAERFSCCFVSNLINCGYRRESAHFYAPHELGHGYCDAFLALSTDNASDETFDATFAAQKFHSSFLIGIHIIVENVDRTSSSTEEVLRRANNQRRDHVDAVNGVGIAEGKS